MHELAPVDILQVIGWGVACDIEEMLVTVPEFLLLLSDRGRHRYQEVAIPVVRQRGRSQWGL